MLKGKENNKSAFYSKINGFFGSFKNNHYLCKQKETNIIYSSAAPDSQIESQGYEQTI